jgi:hypothetical protein
MYSPLIWLLPAIALCMQVQTQEPFGIQFIDEQTKRPIPLVEIQTVHHLKWVSDKLGWIAIDETSLEGPWTKAVKVASHDQYSFYNPMIHPVFGTDPGRTLYFEGTYTTTFSGNQNPTPRYDYNQILYRFDLDSLGLP